MAPIDGSSTLRSLKRPDGLARIRCRVDEVHGSVRSTVHYEECQGIFEAHALDEVASVLVDVERAVRAGFTAVGFVSYEAAPAFDRALTVRGASLSVPLAWFALFDRAVATEEVRLDARPAPGASSWRCDIDEVAHQEAVETVRAAIGRGETYLTNLTTRFRRPWGSDESPNDLFTHLSQQYTTGQHVLIETDEWSVVCASPERFFSLNDSVLMVQPMKGTAPRGRWLADDDAVGQSLRASAKEQSENVMVVDMMRNDLALIATTGSVQVPILCEIERHPTMWHMTSTVTATLRPECGLVDIFGALFPCASVTGAPKASTMRHISRVESSARGLYCGAVGVVRPSGDTIEANFSVAIRTAVIDHRAGEVTYGAGGGITWDSVASQEWAELQLKAQSLWTHDASDRDLPALFETMFVGVGEVRNLARHVARLRDSATYFSHAMPHDVVEQITRYASTRPNSRLKVLLHPTGELVCESSPLPLSRTGPLRLCIDQVPVDSTSPYLFHKTTQRQVYEERSARHPHADDALLVNERGEVTETTRANVAALIDGVWWTPPLESGLLPGVERGRLLELGELRERTLTVADVQQADAVAIMNSLRGWQAAVVVPCQE